MRAARTLVARTDASRDRGAADVRCTTRTSRRPDRTGARCRQMGGVRSLQRCDLRLPGRRTGLDPRNSRPSSSGSILGCNPISPSSSIWIRRRRQAGSKARARRRTALSARRGFLRAGTKRLSGARRHRPARIRIIDAAGSPEQIREQVLRRSSAATMTLAPGSSCCGARSPSASISCPWRAAERSRWRGKARIRRGAGGKALVRTCQWRANGVRTMRALHLARVGQSPGLTTSYPKPKAPKSRTGSSRSRS